MSDPLIQVERLTRVYREDHQEVRALGGVDLRIARGEFLAIAGPSGSGKTTLLNLIGGLDLPTSGRVVIEGRDLAALDGADLAEYRRANIGFVFQAYNLVPVLSALENVEYVMLLLGVPRDERRARARAMLSAVGLDGLERRKPADLSGGQQQRVAVARAIAA
ncbi:MAG: ATP-binding cassette domain-containing protein, partial [bacterium]